MTSIMDEDLASSAGKIPDLPSGLAPPQDPPSVVWIAVRPDLFGLPPWAVTGIFLGGVLILFLLARLLIRLFPKPKSGAATVDLPPPREEAKSALSLLRGTLAFAPAREVALRLSGILRRFAEREYGIGLTTQTHEEFSALAAQYPDALPGPFANELLAFLDDCDQAIFKPGADPADLNHQLWDQASRLIQQARPPARNR